MRDQVLSDLTAIFCRPFHTGGGCNCGLGTVAVLAQQRGRRGILQGTCKQVSWGRSKITLFFFFFFGTPRQFVQMTSIRTGTSDGHSHAHTALIWRQQHPALPEHSPKHPGLLLTPSPCFSPNSGIFHPKSTVFHNTRGQAGGFHLRAQDACSSNTSVSRVGLSDAEGVVQGRGWLVFFFFPLNESNLINITIRSLVWKQCRAKFSNRSLCHITLGTFVCGAHLAPTALTLPSAPSIPTGTQTRDTQLWLGC